MGLRLIPLVHEERIVHWSPSVGIEVGWRLGVWCSADDRVTVASMLEAFVANRVNLDPSPFETLQNLHALIQKFVRDHRAVTLHDGIREHYLEVERTP